MLPVKDERDEDGDCLAELQPAGERPKDIAEAWLRVHLDLFLFQQLGLKRVIWKLAKGPQIATFGQ